MLIIINTSYDVVGCLQASAPAQVQDRCDHFRLLCLVLPNDSCSKLHHREVPADWSSVLLGSKVFK